MFDELEEVFHGRDDVTGLESVAIVRTFGTWNEATRAGWIAYHWYLSQKLPN